MQWKCLEHDYIPKYTYAMHAELSNPIKFTKSHLKTKSGSKISVSMVTTLMTANA